MNSSFLNLIFGQKKDGSKQIGRSDGIDAKIECRIDLHKGRK